MRCVETVIAVSEKDSCAHLRPRPAISPCRLSIDLTEDKVNDDFFRQTDENFR